MLPLLYTTTNTAHFMSMNSEIAIEDGDTPIESKLHTRYATPRRLSRELKDLLGDSTQFKIEVGKYFSPELPFQTDFSL